MWICPKCKESIEDQFDSCWKCAGAELHEPPPNDSLLVWIYPAISLLSLFGIGALAGFFWRSPHHAGGYFSFGGAVFGIIVSAICIWMFFLLPVAPLVCEVFDAVVSDSSFWVMESSPLVHIFFMCLDMIFPDMEISCKPFF